MGGQQPIVNAHVAIYVAGTGGNGTAAQNLMGTGTGSPLAYTTTDVNGKFSLQGDFTCPASTSSYTPQAYVVATGGNPGLATNPSNNAIILMDALGPCSSIGQSTVISINEVTTVAAAWALAPFMTSYANIASSATNGAGLANAFLNAQLIADPATGISPGSALTAINNTATSGTVSNTIETGKVYALADVIATCVNSDGTTSCNTLYSTIGLCSSCTSDTLTAALYVVKHPGLNVPAIFKLIPANQPYATNLTLPPNDWTLSLTVTGGGLASPTGIGLDTAGNVWVADYYGAVSAFTPQGATLANPATYPNGFGYGSSVFGYGSGKPAGEIYGLTVDTNNLVWVDIQHRCAQRNFLRQHAWFRHWRGIRLLHLLPGIARRGLQRSGDRRQQWQWNGEHLHLHPVHEQHHHQPEQRGLSALRRAQRSFRRRQRRSVAGRHRWQHRHPRRRSRKHPLSSQLLRRCKRDCHR